MISASFSDNSDTNWDSLSASAASRAATCRSLATMDALWLFTVVNLIRWSVNDDEMHRMTNVHLLRLGHLEGEVEPFVL